MTKDEIRNIAKEVAAQIKASADPVADKLLAKIAAHPHSYLIVIGWTAGCVAAGYLLGR